MYETNPENADVQYREEKGNEGVSGTGNPFIIQFVTGKRAGTGGQKKRKTSGYNADRYYRKRPFADEFREQQEAAEAGEAYVEGFLYDHLGVHQQEGQ